MNAHFNFLMKSFSKKAQAGFNLVEVALALGVIGFGVVAVLGVMPQLLSSSRSAMDYSEVALVAQELIEREHSSTLTADQLNALYGIGSVSSTNCVSSSQSFRFRTVVEYIPATNVIGTNATIQTPIEYKTSVNGRPLLRTVRISYLWPPTASKPQSFTFVTEIAATRDIEMGN